MGAYVQSPCFELKSFNSSSKTALFPYIYVVQCYISVLKCVSMDMIVGIILNKAQMQHNTFAGLEFGVSSTPLGSIPLPLYTMWFWKQLHRKTAYFSFKISP